MNFLGSKEKLKMFIFTLLEKIYAEHYSMLRLIEL